MKILFLFVFCLGIQLSFGQTSTPLIVSSGFTADIVAEATDANTKTTAAVDGSGGYVFMTTAFPGATSGLPTSGAISSITTSGLNFQLGSYTENNSLRMTGTETKTLVFSNQEKAEQIAILTTSGGGSADFTGVITFTDNTTQAITTKTSNDWYNGSSPAIKGIGRVKRSNDADVQNSSDNPRLYQIIVGIDVPNQTKNIKEISFTRLSSSSGILNVMGVTAMKNFPIQYCLPSFSSTSYGITKFVTTNGISNISNSSSEEPYHDYTTQSTSQVPGQTINFTITGNSTDMGFGLWVDWNKDGQFDDTNPNSERIYNSGGSYISQGAGTITVPAGTAPGNYRIRIVANWFSSSPIPCGDLGSSGYGEAEDYTLTVISLANCSGIPNAGTTSNISICENTAFDLVSNGTSSPANGLTGVWQSSLDGVSSWTDIVGASTPTYTLSAGISTATYYRYKMFCSFSNQTAYSTTMQASLKPIDQCYCLPSSSSANYGITNFTTTNGISNISNSSSEEPYHDYTTQSTSQVPGQTINFTITGNSTSMGFGLWVDWNKDGQFDNTNPNSERIYNSGNYIAQGTGTITVPAGTAPGNYRIRIVANYYSSSPIPCGDLGSSGYGEAEDYTLVVLDPNDCYPPFTFSDISSGVCSVKVAWDATFGSTPASYQYELRTSGVPESGMNGLRGSGTTADNFVNFNGLTLNETYTLYVRTNCTDNSESNWSAGYIFTVTEDYLPVTVTGFNQDIIAEAATPSTTTTTSADKSNISTETGTGGSGNNYVLFSKNFSTWNGQGLPNDGLINSNGRRFQLAPYNQNNTLKLDVTTTNGTLQFTPYVKAANVYVMGTSTEGSSTFDLVVTFTDGTTESVLGNVMDDWATSSSNSVIENVGRVQREYGGVDQDYTHNVKLFEVQIPISLANQSKKITKMDVTLNSPTNNILHIMSISMEHSPIQATLTQPAAVSICHGNTVEVSGTISNADGNWAMYLTYGDTITGTGDGTWTALATPDGDGVVNIGIESISDDITCQNTVSGSTAVTLPIRTSVLSGNNEAATCFISGNQPIHFYEPITGHYIGAINPNGREGIVTMTSYINNFSGIIAGQNDGTMYACNEPTEEAYRTAYMKRGFVINPDAGGISGNGNLTVYFPFTQSEFDDLKTRSSSVVNGLGNSSQNTSDAVNAISDVMATKYDGTNENDDATDNCSGGVSTFITQLASNVLPDAYVLTPEVDKNSSNVNEVIYYASFNVTDFSEFHFHGINNNSPLPIELISFSGNCKAGNSLLKWTTATETNVNHFEIQRSLNGQEWETVGQITAVGNSSHQNSYETAVRQNDEIAYYRLIAVDDNGARNRFNPISVVCSEQESSWSIYPIPVTGDANLSIISEEEAQHQLTIVDVNGRIIETKSIQLHIGMNLFGFQLQSLSSGVYFVTMDDKQYKPLKFLKL